MDARYRESATFGGDSVYRSGAPRPMKMGTIASPRRYDDGSRPCATIGPFAKACDPSIRFTGRAIAYDQLQPCVDTVVASHDLSASRPCERRDPSPLASKVKKGLGSSAGTRARAAAMSAIALTLGSLRSQGRLIENSICDSPTGGNVLRVCRRRNTIAS